jgi:hypothetical protein
MKMTRFKSLIIVLILGLCQLSAASDSEEFQLGNLFEAQYGFKVPQLPVHNLSKQADQTKFDLEILPHKQYLVLEFKESSSFPRQVVEFSAGMISALLAHEDGHKAEARRQGCRIRVDVLRNTWSAEEVCQDQIESIAAAGLISQKYFVESLLADGKLDSPFEWGVAVFDITNSIGYPIHDHITGKGDLSYLKKDKKIMLSITISGHAIFRVLPKLMDSVRSR